MEAHEISFIIPVYNRPDEIKELLQSFEALHGSQSFEIVIIEDGSTLPSKSVIEQFNDHLNITYFFKENSGPGDSRNYGMKHAKGNYFIILDSDCILPPEYLNNVLNGLQKNYTDCFGGPDNAHNSFSALQKAINFSMTSFITTGGIRGGKKSVNTFQPRSFNMGISKKAFQESGGFGRIHPGEDPDLSIRLWNLGYKTQLIPDAYVYHKRRISWSKFYKQVNKFGMVRPILNAWHPKSKRITYWFPTLFILGLVGSVVFALLLKEYFPLIIYGCYFSISFMIALIQTKNLKVAILSQLAILIQFFGYGLGFLKATLKIGMSNKHEEEIFPELFFRNA